LWNDFEATTDPALHAQLAAVLLRAQQRESALLGGDTPAHLIVQAAPDSRADDERVMQGLSALTTDELHELHRLNEKARAAALAIDGLRPCVELHQHHPAERQRGAHDH
jgi:hypothetical protein